jgi:ATPase subunit of ABC transporter with duplicated ATPase domains
MFVELSHVSFAHEGGEALFDDVSLRFERGVTALVGENGAGKSTLLALVAGELSPERGTIRVEPRGARLALCRQEVEVRTRDVEAFGDAADACAAQLRGTLGLDPAELARWPTLSPGERRRWQLGAVLASEPDVLALDEPTNHVDEQGRAQVSAALARFRGVCLLVSHDRALIDALAARTVRVHGGTLRAVDGGYGTARAVWQAEADGALARRESARRELRKVERKLADARRVQASSERNVGAGARMRNAGDREARSMGARNLAAWAEARASRTVGILRDRAEDARGELAITRVEKVHGRTLFARYVPCPRPRLCVLEAPEVRRAGVTVLRDVPAVLERDARIRIRGPNGAGKTTLLRALATRIPEPERVLFLPQELAPAQVQVWLERTRSLPRDERGRVLDVVAALGIDPDRLLASPAPSHGEARKLALAHGLVRGVWALLLDEPTNHLDLPSIERLEAALADYPGALVVVTHDPTFLEGTLTRAWTLAEGRVVVS